MLKTILRLALIICILITLLASNLYLVPMGVALGYIACCTATLMLTYV
jgi:hypothetical protein